MTRPKLTPERIETRTDLARGMRRDILSRADKLRQDRQKSTRHAYAKCQVCYYIPRIAGQAVTQYQCSQCDEAWLTGCVQRRKR